MAGAGGRCRCNRNRPTVQFLKKRKTGCANASTRPKSAEVTGSNRRHAPHRDHLYNYFETRPGFQDRNVCFSRHVDQRQHAVRSSQLAPRGPLTTASSDTASIEASCNAAIARKFLFSRMARWFRSHRARMTQQPPFFKGTCGRLGLRLPLPAPAEQT